MRTNKIAFLTGTRADYGKIKSLMQEVEKSEKFELFVFVTGMHMLSDFGSTINEVKKGNFKNIHSYINQFIEEPMDVILANTINGFSRYCSEIKPDLIVVHGDRVEALAATIVGALNNIHVAHIEGGEVSGTIDESIRHSISKMAHFHFVANEKAKARLIQLGENSDNIFVIGSPNIDIIKNTEKDIEKVKEYYDITFDKYAICMYHPVTTEVDEISEKVKNLVDAILESDQNFILVKPNNDHGFKAIEREYKRLLNCDRVKMFPSIRFEYYLELLKNAEFILGNSSSGIHEAPLVVIPTINIGTRQKDRFEYVSIINVDENKDEILKIINDIDKYKGFEKTEIFGEGNSAEQFIDILSNKISFSEIQQKKFYDLEV